MLSRKYELSIYPNEANPTQHMKYKITKKENIIGKSKHKCDIALIFSDISDIHAKLTIIEPDDFIIKDLNSEYGTFKYDEENDEKMKMISGKEYDLILDFPFYISRYKCVISENNSSFQIESSENPEKTATITKNLPVYGKKFKPKNLSNKEQKDSDSQQDDESIHKAKIQEENKKRLLELQGIDEENAEEVENFIEKLKSNREELKKDNKNLEGSQNKLKISKNKRNFSNNSLKMSQDVTELNPPTKKGLLHSDQNIEEIIKKKENIQTEIIKKEPEKKIDLKKNLVKFSQENEYENIKNIQLESKKEKLNEIVDNEDEINHEVSIEEVKNKEKINKKPQKKLENVKKKTKILEEPKIEVEKKEKLKKNNDQEENEIKKIKKNKVQNKGKTSIKSKTEEDLNDSENHTQDTVEPSSKSKKRSNKQVSTTSVVLSKHSSNDNSFSRNSSKKKHKKIRSLSKLTKYKLKIGVSGFLLDPEEIFYLKSIGIKIVEDKEQPIDFLVLKSFKRTIRFLLAINRGCSVLSKKWLDDCIEQKTILDQTPYTFKDKESEKKFGFKLQDSLQMAKTKKEGVFAGFSFWMPRNIQPSYEEIKLLILSGGGAILMKRPFVEEENSFILMPLEDKEQIQKLKLKSFKIYSTEMIFMAILRQKINFENYII